MAWLVLSACGGVYRRSPGDDEPTAGSGGVGGTGDVTVPGGRGGAGPGGVGPGGFVAGGFGAVGAEAGFGGTATEPMAGAGGQSCTPSAPIAGEPRRDGPTAYMGCDDIPDSVLKQRFVDFEARVPQGLFYDREMVPTVWTSMCMTNQTLAGTRGPDGMSTFLGSSCSPWDCGGRFCSRGQVVTQKGINCDFFDGNKLSAPDPGWYPMLASVLWWRDNYNTSGAAILGYSVQVGNATDVVELCTLAGVQGDFGLCDRLELYSVKYRISFGGEVTPEKPALLRTVQGKCH